MLCEYFALCDNPADGTVDHPILGTVPTCNRCATMMGGMDKPITKKNETQYRN